MTRILYVDDNDDRVYTLKAYDLDCWTALKHGETGCAMVLAEQLGIIISPTCPLVHGGKPHAG